MSRQQTPAHDKVDLTINEHLTIMRWEMESLREALDQLGEACRHAVERLHRER